MTKTYNYLDGEYKFYILVYFFVYYWRHFLGGMFWTSLKIFSQILIFIIYLFIYFQLINQSVMELLLFFLWHINHVCYLIPTPVFTHIKKNCRYTQLNNQTFLFLTIQFSIIHLFAFSLNVKQFYLTHR